MVEDSPEDYIHVLLGQAFWGSHALGRSVLGTRRNIINFNRDILLNYFQRLYQPDRILISAAGNVDHDRFVDIVGPAFASVETGNGLPDRTMPKGLASAAVHPREIEQAHLCLCTNGLSITDPNRYGFSLMNTLLGGNMSSRLFQEIREQRGLAYSVYSFMSSHSDAGMFGAYAGVDPKNVRESLRLIIKEMNRIKQTAVADDELRDAKEFTKGSLLLASESVDNQMVRLAQNEIHFGDQIPLQEVVARIEAVTPDEIRELAARLFQSDQLTLTILGPVDDTEPFNELLVL